MRLLLSVLFVVMVVLSAQAQRDVEDRAKWSLQDRGYLGIGLGGLGLGSSSYYGKYFTIGLTGQGGYMITKNLSAGIGAEYQYTNYSDLKITDQVFGGYPFIRYNVFKQFFVQTDYDFYSISVDARYKARNIYNRFFVGAGYSSPAGRRGRFNILVSYDLLYTNTSVFNSPLSYRAYFTF
jgi:hypothetical protein